MRIAIVNKYAHLTGGADQHCLGLAEALIERGHDVRFLSTRSDKNVVDDGVFIPANVTHGSRESLSLSTQARVLRSSIWNPAAADGMKRLLTEYRPDVVHTHKLYPQLSVAPVVVASRARVPVVQTLHDFEMISASPIDARGGVWDHDETRIRFKLLNSATRPVHRRLHAPRVSRFVAVSRFVQRVHALHGLEATVVPNFVYFAESELARDPTPFDDRDGIIFLGRLQPEKGARDAVEMARRLPKMRVTLVGTGDLEEELRRQAEGIPRLRVAGFVPDDELRELLRRSRVVVIPSLCQDAGPLVPLESMAHGTPVVAYAMGGLAEYVSDSGGGVIVPVDVQALAQAAREIHDDRQHWEKLSARGLSAVARNHTPAVYAERIEAIYDAARLAGCA